jgi:hypothetical protein
MCLIATEEGPRKCSTAGFTGLAMDSKLRRKMKAATRKAGCTRRKLYRKMTNSSSLKPQWRPRNHRRIPNLFSRRRVRALI